MCVTKDLMLMMDVTGPYVIGSEKGGNFAENAKCIKSHRLYSAPQPF